LLDLRQLRRRRDDTPALAAVDQAARALREADVSDAERGEPFVYNLRD